MNGEPNTFDVADQRIHAGQTVRTSDGHKLGKVQGVASSYVMVTGGKIFWAKFYYVPLTAIERVSRKEILLSIAKSDPLMQDWLNPPLPVDQIDDEELETDSLAEPLPSVAESGKNAQTSTPSIARPSTSEAVSEPPVPQPQPQPRHESAVSRNAGQAPAPAPDTTAALPEPDESESHPGSDSDETPAPLAVSPAQEAPAAPMDPAPPIESGRRAPAPRITPIPSQRRPGPIRQTGTGATIAPAPGEGHTSQSASCRGSGGRQGDRSADRRAQAQTGHLDAQCGAR